MSIAQNFPNLKPTLLLDFANTESLDPRITFTRASTATYYGTQTAKAEENLLLQSQDITNAVWININTTDSANTTTAPDGTSTADTLAEIAATTFFAIAQNISSTSGLAYTYSVFLKKGSGATAPDIIQLTFALGGFGSTYANFNLNTGAVGTTSGLTASIVSAGNGWYRCIVTATANASATSNVQIVFTNNNDGLGRAPSYAGAATSDLFVWGAQLEQRSAVTAYTPTTTQPITNYIPVLETAASGVARFDHNPTTFESLGFLVEEQRTNLQVYSQEFDNAAWTKSNSSITANTIVSPDGTLDGDKLVENTASSTHLAIAVYTFTSAAHTASFYAKQGGRNFIRLVMFDGTASFAAYFNIATGTVGTTTGSVTASITAVGNGWFRCAITGTTSAGLGNVAIRLASADATDSYTGDGYSGVYIWGAQLEAGAFPTSYIPTVASQVTRAADAASMTGANFSNFYNQSEGTLFAEYSRLATSQSASSLYAVAINDNTTSNMISISNNFGGANDRYQVTTSGVAQATIIVGTASNGFVKKAGTYKVNSFQLAKDGVLGSEDTVGTVPVVDRMGIGNYQGGGIAQEILNGNIRKIAYYPSRLSNTQLQGLTS